MQAQHMYLDTNAFRYFGVAFENVSLAEDLKWTARCSITCLNKLWSYGLFVELNPKDIPNTNLNVFSGEESFETTSRVFEEPGNWFAPHLGSLITAGGRLLLAMLEKCITDAGGQYLFCDTDSAAIVSWEHGGEVSMPDGANPIRALSREEVQSIVDRFESLNPYDRKLVPGSILKVHKLNWDKNKQRRQLYGYSIAAKRYALYTKS